MSWLGGTAQRWIALVGLIGTVVGTVSFAASEQLPWAWLAIGALALLVVSLAWSARDEYERRISAQNEPHQPPGGGIPLVSPVDYQINALRQVIPRLAEAMQQFGRWELEEVLKNLPRHGVDPVYEPLRTYDEGLARLVELGELESLNRGTWRIVKT